MLLWKWSLNAMYCQEFGQNLSAKYFGFSRHCKRDEWFSVPRARQSWKRAIPPCPQRPPQEVWASCQRGDCTDDNTLILQYYYVGNVKLSNREPFKNYLAPLGEILPLDGIKLNFMAKTGQEKAKDRLQRAKNSVFGPKIPACWVKKSGQIGGITLCNFFCQKTFGGKNLPKGF